MILRLLYFITRISILQTSAWIPTIKITLSHNRLIFIMEIPIPGNMVFTLKLGPRWLVAVLSCPRQCFLTAANPLCWLGNDISNEIKLLWKWVWLLWSAQLALRWPYRVNCWVMAWDKMNYRRESWKSMLPYPPMAANWQESGVGFIMNFHIGEYHNLDKNIHWCLILFIILIKSHANE